MKKNLLIFSALLIGTSLNAQQQMGNSGMEDWQNVGTDAEEPTNWSSFKTASGSMAWAASKQIQRSTDVRSGASGQYSARIWSKSVLGVVANGNMTIGQVNMGNSTASHPDNHNWSNTANADNSETLTDSPDSIVFWVKYNPVNANHLARLSVILHDSYNFKDPNEVNDNVHCVATAIYNYPTTNGQWVRKSFPFTYDGDVTAAHTYILATFATSNTPGGGSANDEVFIDDIQLIYNQQVVAVDDVVTTFQNTSVDVSVLGNDVDPENSFNTSSINITVQPTNGTVNVNTSTGVITYTPNAGFIGNDSFTYEVCDNGVVVTCDNAVVSITVNEPGAGNNQIVANDDNASTTINTPVVTNVVANDVDFENQIDLSSLQVVNQPSNGLASANTTTGEITYTPDAGFLGADSYTYSICDLGTPATCDEAIVNVNVTSSAGLGENAVNYISYKMEGNVLSFILDENQNGTVRIIDLAGKLVASGQLTDKFELNANGFFLINISTGNFDQTIKIVK